MKKSITTITSIIACAVASYAAADCNASTNCSCASKADKQINTLADEDVCANLLERFSASVTVGFESEYVFRAKKYAGASINPEVDAAYDLGMGFSVYAGVWGNMPVKSSTTNEMDVYTGVTYDIANFTFDLGYIGYLYSDSAERNSHEVKFALTYDTVDFLGDFNVSPTAAFFYDFITGYYTVEAGASYSAPVTKWIADRDWGKINLAAVYGWTTSSSNGYTYVAVSADAVIAINDYCSVSVGARYAYSHDTLVDRTDKVWYGTSLTVGF